MDKPPGDPSLDQTFQEILNKTEYSTSNLTPEAQQQYLNSYSPAALILNFVYYKAMGDKLLTWLSVIASLTIFLIPLLFIFPIWARRRAYAAGKWQSFGEFEQVQAKWDQASYYSLIAVVVIFYLLLHYLGPTYEKTLKQLSNSGSTNPTQQIQQAKTGLQQELGQ